MVRRPKNSNLRWVTCDRRFHCRRGTMDWVKTSPDTGVPRSRNVTTMEVLIFQEFCSATPAETLESRQYNHYSFMRLLFFEIPGFRSVSAASVR